MSLSWSEDDRYYGEEKEVEGLFRVWVLHAIRKLLSIFIINFMNFFDILNSLHLCSSKINSLLKLSFFQLVLQPIHWNFELSTLILTIKW